jgi:hypothetical protein
MRSESEDVTNVTAFFEQRMGGEESGHSSWTRLTTARSSLPRQMSGW